jgi:hypothetical protein
MKRVAVCIILVVVVACFVWYLMSNSSVEGYRRSEATYYRAYPLPEIEVPDPRASIAEPTVFSAENSPPKILSQAGLEDINPVLTYARQQRYLIPTSYGDPINIPPIAGPSSPMFESRQLRQELGGSETTDQGFYKGKTAKPQVMGVPIPQGSLKISNERYKYPFYKAYIDGDSMVAIPPQDALKFAHGNVNAYSPHTNFDGNQGISSPNPYTPVNGNERPLYRGGATYDYTYKQLKDRAHAPGGFDKPSRPNTSFDYMKPYGPNPNIESNIPFFGSVSSFAPFPEVLSDWEKVGLLSPVETGKDGIMNLYRSPVAPLQDLWKYSVQDKSGFIIPLDPITYLQNGDIVPSIVGKANVGPWKVSMFVNNKYIWM